MSALKRYSTLILLTPGSPLVSCALVSEWFRLLRRCSYVHTNFPKSVPSYLYV
jgi:hypothetical protein